jgi:TolB-like protein
LLKLNSDRLTTGLAFSCAPRVLARAFTTALEAARVSTYNARVQTSETLVFHWRRLLFVMLALGAALATPAALAADGKPRVAVMDFTSPGAPADLSALGSGLQSMITTDLAQLSTVQVVERARLQAVEKELQLGHSKAVDPSTAAKLGKLAGATHLVVKTFAVVGKQMRLDGRVVDPAGGPAGLRRALYRL